MKRKWQGPRFRVLCATNEKTIDHIFLNCPFSIHIWSQLANYIKMKLLCLLPSAYLFKSDWKYTSINKCDRVTWDFIVVAIFGGIWREHNNRIFNSSARSSDQTFHV